MATGDVHRDCQSSAPPLRRSSPGRRGGRASSRSPSSLSVSWHCSMRCRGRSSSRTVPGRQAVLLYLFDRARLSAGLRREPPPASAARPSAGWENLSRVVGLDSSCWSAACWRYPLLRLLSSTENLLLATTVASAFLGLPLTEQRYRKSRATSIKVAHRYIRRAADVYVECLLLLLAYQVLLMGSQVVDFLLFDRGAVQRRGADPLSLRRTRPCSISSTSCFSPCSPAR